MQLAVSLNRSGALQAVFVIVNNGGFTRKKIIRDTHFVS